ncbi:MAG TPA: ATP-dependent Clp protease proteolytic subunit [Candidatus Lokiarchaeia archaeon]|nr:ATP-dependent Clp protease proteolytic subunit [Candidatus Lokiarchaeia archaeon]
MKDETDDDKLDITPFFDYGIDIHTKTLYIGDVEDPDDDDRGVNARVASKAIKGLHLLDHVDTIDPITILLNMEGGDEVQCLAIYDAIKACAHQTTIKVFGQCLSGGVWILQAATNRLVAPNARLMIHAGTWGVGEDHPTVVKTWVKQYEKDEELSENILLERIWEKQPEFTREQLREMLRFDTIFTPQEAIDLGLADAIILKSEIET